jgi:DNA mismatch repair protein MutS2
MRVEEALALVEKRLNEALLSEIDSLEIIHGVGTGRLKVAVHQYLGGLGVVKHYKLDEGNPGTTWVYF